VRLSKSAVTVYSIAADLEREGCYMSECMLHCLLSEKSISINHVVAPNSIEKGEDFAALGDKLEESTMDSGSTNSPSDDTSEDSAAAVEMSSLLHTHSAEQLLSNPVSPPPRSVPTGWSIDTVLQ